jgi:hypothetical protein
MKHEGVEEGEKGSRWEGGKVGRGDKYVTSTRATSTRKETFDLNLF